MKSKIAAEYDAPAGFTDIHHHILYGVDDGAQTWEDTQRMLRAAVADGIGAVIATPHVYLGIRPFNAELCRSRLLRINEYCVQADLPLDVRLGAEVFCGQEPIISTLVQKLADGSIPTMADSRFVLMEFPPDISFASMERMLAGVQGNGYHPIAAHIERYDCLVRHPENVRELRGMRGVRLQMNCNTILNARGLRMRWFVQRALRERWIDYAATDAHNTSTRPVYMRECHDEIAGRADKEYAAALCGINQKEILTQPARSAGAIVGHPSSPL